jgi:glycosyltransferase 2 family protein
MFKALRFKIILRNNIGFWRISSIVSLYMLFANVLPMRAGELSYMYLLKKNANTSGTKSFASLITGAFADAFIILIAMVFVAWHLRTEIANRSTEISISGLFSSLLQKILGSKLFLIIAISVLIIIIVAILLKLRNYRARLIRFWAYMKCKSIEIFNELINIRFDFRLLEIIVFSILIIILRFGTQWVIVRSMNLEIDIWQFCFAILFGVLFSLLPIHGPAGFGTVEAPWVLALAYLGVPSKDAIISGFSLHIIIILFCAILGIYGAIGLNRLKIED